MRDIFTFIIVCMPYIDSNIPKSIFSSALVAEFLRIVGSCLLYIDFHDYVYYIFINFFEA